MGDDVRKNSPVMGDYVRKNSPVMGDYVRKNCPMMGDMFEKTVQSSQLFLVTYCNIAILVYGTLVKLKGVTN